MIRLRSNGVTGDQRVAYPTGKTNTTMANTNVKWAHYEDIYTYHHVAGNSTGAILQLAVKQLL